MGKFLDITEIVKEKANLYAEFHYTSIREFANITQDVIENKVLFLVNSDNMQGNSEIPSRILSEFEFDIWIVQNHKLEDEAVDIALIQDKCLVVMNEFVYEMQKPNSDYLPLGNWSFRMVRNQTPNAFAGVRFTLKIKTGCNL